MRSIEQINEDIKENRKNGVSVKKVSNGYHTSEDYDTRVAHLVIALCRSNPDISWKTKKHFDEENDPMFNGDFLVGINTPGGVVSYHLKMKYWDLLNIPEIERGPKYDGYTEEDVNKRLLTIGTIPVSSEIDSKYLNELFRYIAINSASLYVPHDLDDDAKSDDEDFHDKTIVDVFEDNLPELLDTIVAYADKHDIHEITGNDGTYGDDRYYYIVRYNDITLKLGLLYNRNIVFIEIPDDYEDEDVINCEDVLKELTIQEKQNDSGSKGLSLKPSNKKKKEEEDK